MPRAPRKPRRAPSPPPTPASQIERTGGVVHEIVMRNPRDLKPLPGNPKLHPERQLEQLRASLREFGFTIPALVDEQDVIRAGNGRVEAAMLEGFTEVPTIVAKGWSETQLRAYVIADNKLTENGGWDKEALRSSMIELSASGFPLELTGYREVELSRLDVPGFEFKNNLENQIATMKHVVIVDCADEPDQAAKLEQLMGLGLTVRALIV